MACAISGFGFHLPPQGQGSVTCSMNLFASWLYRIIPLSYYMKTQVLQYYFVNILTLAKLAQIYLIVPGPVQNSIYFGHHGSRSYTNKFIFKIMITCMLTYTTWMCTSCECTPGNVCLALSWHWKKHSATICQAHIYSVMTKIWGKVLG